MHSLSVYWVKFVLRLCSKLLTLYTSQFGVSVYSIDCHCGSHSEPNKYPLSSHCNGERMPPVELIDRWREGHGAWIWAASSLMSFAVGRWNRSRLTAAPQCLDKDNTRSLAIGEWVDSECILRFDWQIDVTIDIHLVHFDSHVTAKQTNSPPFSHEPSNTHDVQAIVIGLHATHSCF